MCQIIVRKSEEMRVLEHKSKNGKSITNSDKEPGLGK